MLDSAPTPIGDRNVMQAGRNVVMWVGMDYPGGVISVNACYKSNGRGGKKLKPEAWRWRNTLQQSFGWLIAAQRIDELWADGFTKDIRVRIDGHFVDENHATDADNLQKLTWDAIKEAIGVDDRHFQPMPGETTYGNAIPYIIVTVYATLAEPGAKGTPAADSAGVTRRRRK